MYVKPRVQHLVIQHAERNLSITNPDTIWATGEPWEGREGGLVAWTNKPEGLLVSMREIRNVFWSVTGMTLHVNPGATRIFDPTRDYEGPVSSSTMSVASVGFDWGDGSSDDVPPSAASLYHAYASTGTYQMTVAINFAPNETILPGYDSVPRFTFPVEVV